MALALGIGLIGGIFVLYGGYILLRRGRGGKMTQHGLVALLLGMVMLACPLIAFLGVLSEPGQGVIAGIPISGQMRLLLLCSFAILFVGVLAILPLVASVWGEKQRKEKIRANKELWGEKICDSLIRRKIAIGMTEDMVLLAWGNPRRRENKELTATRKTTRWIYGQPRRGANYVWFVNGEVSKIQQ